MDRQGITVQPSPRDGKWMGWTPRIIQPGGNGPSGYTTTDSKYTIVDGVFYGYFNVRVPNTSDFGNIDAHWELSMPYTPAKETIADMGLYGWGHVRRDSARPGSYFGCKLEISTFNSYEDAGIIWPILGYYSAARMDNPPDTTLLYESWMWDGLQTTQAKVEGTRTAWQNIATDFGRETIKPLVLSATLRYIIKE